MELTLKLSDIVVEGRLREDLGDIEGLAESIRDNGLFHPPVVERSPLGIYTLRTGGRRYAAHTLLATNKVSSPDPTKYAIIEVRVFNEMPEHQRHKIELEENLRRKSMTWQETVLGIARYHKAARRAALLDHETWSQEQTGELLNMSQASVNVAMRVAAELLSGNEKVAAADNLADAVKALVGAKLDEMQAEQMRRIQEKRAQMVLAGPDTTLVVPRLPTSILVHAQQQKPEGLKEVAQFTKEQVASFYHHGDALSIMPRLKAAGTVIHHVICDPPYGIDMDFLTADSVSRVAETHQVEANVQLLEKFLQVAYDVIERDGFLAMWYDLDHHEKIHGFAVKTGWKVQRWPFIWCKSSPCQNSQAQYNITKSTEVCYLMRRSEQSIIKRKRGNNYLECARASSASHPFVKPDAVWGALVDIVSEVGETVVDPFAGEGSSLAAIFKRRRNPIGIEIDAVHIASGLSYIQELINAKGLLDGMLEEPPL